MFIDDDDDDDEGAGREVGSSGLDVSEDTPEPEPMDGATDHTVGENSVGMDEEVDAAVFTFAAHTGEIDVLSRGYL